MSIQVLLGVEDRDLASSLNAQFQELPDFHVVGVETSSTDVAGAVGGLPSLDVVLLHQKLGPLPAFDLIRELGARRPQLAVVLIAEEATAETFGAAMAAGARGVISDEPTLSELQNRIESAADWSRTMRRHFDPAQASPMPGSLGTMLAVCGAKGGTGATTLAIHLAIAVASTKRTVCLIDMDLQTGDIAGYLDVHHRRSISDLVAAADDMDGTILAEGLFVHPSGPHLLLAPTEGEQAEDTTARAARQILAAVRSRYDVVIVDCGSHMAEANAMAVELADQVLITSTPDLPSLRGAKRLTRLWRRLDIRKEDDVSIVLVRQDRRNEIQPDLARKMLDSPLLGVAVPAVFRALEEAANTGSPGAVKNAEFRKAIGQIARETGLLVDQGAPVPAARDKGVATVEFASAVPFIGFVLLLVWQALLVGLTSMYSSHAANEGARAVAVLGYDTPEARQEVRRRAVARVSGNWRDDKHFHITVDGNYVEVKIDTPAVLPGWRTPFGITTRSRIVPEGGG
jgi:pilus assembly protein CpaE